MTEMKVEGERLIVDLKSPFSLSYRFGTSPYFLQDGTVVWRTVPGVKASFKISYTVVAGNMELKETKRTMPALVEANFANQNHKEE